MRLLLIGATGRTGKQVTQHALAKGHTVTAVVRKPALEEMHGLRVVVADPCNSENLLTALSGQDAGISCLGRRPGGDPWLVRNAAMATLQAMQQAKVSRFVIVSGALLYPSWNPAVLLLKRTMATKLADARAAEQAITGSDANWTIVRPPHLREGDSKGYRIETGTKPRLTFGLQFQDLASCLLSIAEEGTYARQIVGVASR